MICDCFNLMIKMFRLMIDVESLSIISRHLTVSVDSFIDDTVTCDCFKFNLIIKLLRLMIDVDHLSPLDRVG